MAIRDVRRGEPITVLASLERIATPTIDTFRIRGDQPNGLIVTIDATAETDTASVVFTILGVDPLSLKTYVILASAAVDSVTTRILRVSPTITAVGNLIAQDMVPNSFTMTAVHADADPLTYSVSAQLV